MDSTIVDRVARDLARTGARRAALRSLLVTAVVGITLGSAAAKPEPNGKGKAKTKAKRRSRRRGRVSAQAKTKPGNHCVDPEGTDLNEFYGITAQIVAPPPPLFQGCNEVAAGERWVNTRSWLMEPTFKDGADRPEGFVPAGETPLDDFLAKFEGVRYVIDPGSRHEKSVVIPTSDSLFVGEDDGFVLVSPATLGTVHPLPVGEHSFELYWKFSGMHCDGFADPVIELNCFLAGETRYAGPLSFTVVPSHFR